MHIDAPILTLDALCRQATIELRNWDGGSSELPTHVQVGHDGNGLLRILFTCGHSGLHLLPGPTDRPTDRLWERDVVEVFLSDRPEGSPYSEFEASPTGQWLALHFAGPRQPGRAQPPRPTVQAWLEPDRFRVLFELSLPRLRTTTAAANWRIGLFRIAGIEPGRSHASLLRAGLDRPDFHRPESWASLSLT